MAKTMPARSEGAEAEEEEITFHVMSPEEAWESFDQAAQRDLHMTGEAFIQAWDAGEFDEEPERPEVVGLYMLRPLGR
jgi:hypothetical protein